MRREIDGFQVDAWEAERYETRARSRSDICQASGYPRGFDMFSFSLPQVHVKGFSKVCIASTSHVHTSTLHWATRRLLDCYITHLRHHASRREKPPGQCQPMNATSRLYLLRWSPDSRLSASDSKTASRCCLEERLHRLMGAS